MVVNDFNMFYSKLDHEIPVFWLLKQEANFSK